MRELRVLAADVWYNVSTAVNNSEPLFRSPQDWQVRLFYQALFEARGIYVFDIRGLKLEGDTASFYIKPADGFQLPEIMQWLKQTFAVRFNVIDGRTGHIWGDRYRSVILAGEPPEWAEAYVFAPVVCFVSRRRRRCGSVSWREVRSADSEIGGPVASGGGVGEARNAAPSSLPRSGAAPGLGGG